jgi:phosphoglycolate phosphatase-like HAD superfamily hydrolase
VVVELIGPVVDDAGVIGRTLSGALNAAGLNLLPGALAQAAGMSPAHALRTLAEGHGRFELVEEAEQLLQRAMPALAAWAASGPARLVSGAAEGWQSLAIDGTVRAMLTTLPRGSGNVVAGRLGLEVHPAEWLEAGDVRGPPHPDHIVQYLTERGCSDAGVALVHSPGAALAAAAAGCRVIAVGEGSGAALFADQQIAGIGEYQAILRET